MSIFKKLFGSKYPENRSTSSVEETGAINYDYLADYGLSESEKSCFTAYSYVHQNYSIHPITQEEHQALAFMTDFLPDVCFLWGDETSNYAGLFYRGPLKGKIMILDHSNAFYAPLYSSMDSFITSIMDDSTDLAIPTLFSAEQSTSYHADYPAHSQSLEEIETNYTAAMQLLAILDSLSDNEEHYAQTVFQLCYIMPYEHLDELLIFFNSDNMYVLQELPYIFAFHQYRPAIPYLKKAVQKATPYISSHAERALSYYNHL